MGQGTEIKKKKNMIEAQFGVEYILIKPWTVFSCGASFFIYIMNFFYLYRIFYV